MIDMYEVALLFGCTFLVNYVTQDAKTNWVSRSCLSIAKLLDLIARLGGRFDHGKSSIGLHVLRELTIGCRLHSMR
jgi:hypothetical protein